MLCANGVANLPSFHQRLFAILSEAACSCICRGFLLPTLAFVSAMKSTSSAKENHSANWAFNFRSSHFGAYNDTDSDSEEGPAVPTEKDSEEAKLVKDLDISERQDTAVYKPNPFSIAKINAAARTVNNVDKPATRPEPAPCRDTNKLKAPFTIVDGFKRQAQRAQSATKGKAPALKLAPRPPAPKHVHVSNQQKKPFFTTLAPHNGEKLGTSG